ncbi:hypothetical protein L1765_00275 [Microaerobacter geothermalis]|uniref:hypothetical protein n=1 Tax=Microaerobacter geothermalis TaxID=674972 RepID=UPI001F3279DF|nr:hypothetical protein [Microaerobacter geothermalis]MCF6092426.1 hypothetical protein [Microaerobacter geothermalis]
MKEMKNRNRLSKKRLIALGLFLTFVLILSACGSDSASKTSENQSASEGFPSKSSISEQSKMEIADQAQGAPAEKAEERSAMVLFPSGFGGEKN